MRVSIVNCVSTAAEMMKFSDTSLFENAHHENFDYVIVKWLATPEVEAYLTELQGPIISRWPLCRVHVVEHKTDSSIGYVPNLRQMMNKGFDLGFLLNPYAGLVNTDCYFGPGWLKGLVDRVLPNRVINSFHITAANPPRSVLGILTENLGVPEPSTFNLSRFQYLYKQHYQEDLIVAPSEDHRQVTTMPYLLHQKYWASCGPWECTLKNGTPDVRFFSRIAEKGAEFALTHASIIYHHEAVERRRSRPAGSEDMKEE
jgi:hypothetical protein